MNRRQAFAIASALAIVFVACTYRPGPDQGPDQGRPGPPGRRGGTLVFAVADDAGLLDPQIASQPGAFALIRATQRGLTAFPPSRDGRDRSAADPIPDLADGPPDVTADGLQYTFRLRDGIAFGPPLSRPLTGADVKAGLQRAIRLDSPLRPYLRVIDGAADVIAGRAATVRGIDTTRPRTVVIRLTEPANDLLWMLAHPAASAVPDGIADAVAPADLPSSGPYRIERVEPGRRIRLARNPAWNPDHDDVREAYVDAIDVRVGNASGADLTGDDISLDPAAPTVPVDAGCLLYVFVAPAGAFARPQARSAVSLAIDRTALIRDAIPHATPAGTLLPTGDANTEPPPPARPAEARRRLGAPVRVPLGREISGPDARQDALIAAALTRMLAAAGITATPLTVPAPGSIYQRYEAGGVPMGIARWCPDWPGRSVRTMVAALAGTGGAANYARSTDATLDRLIAATLAERTPARIPAATEAAAARALAVATVLPLAFIPDQVQVGSRVQGFTPSSIYVRGDPANVWLTAPEPSPAPAGGATSIAVRYTFRVPATHPGSRTAPNGGLCC